MLEYILLEDEAIASISRDNKHWRLTVFVAKHKARYTWALTVTGMHKLASSYSIGLAPPFSGRTFLGRQRALNSPDQPI